MGLLELLIVIWASDQQQYIHIIVFYGAGVWYLSLFALTASFSISASSPINNLGCITVGVFSAMIWYLLHLLFIPHHLLLFHQ